MNPYINPKIKDMTITNPIAYSVILKIISITIKTIFGSLNSNIKILFKPSCFFLCGANNHLPNSSLNKTNAGTMEPIIKIKYSKLHRVLKGITLNFTQHHIKYKNVKLKIKAI